MGVDIPQTIRRLGKHIGYVHFRDIEAIAKTLPRPFTIMVRPTWPKRFELCARLASRLPAPPDHVPQLEGEDDGEPGYTMLGRLFAVRIHSCLIHATAR